MARTSVWRRVCSIAVLAPVLLAASGNALAQSVVLVTDLAGQVTGTAPIGITAELAAGTRVDVAPGASLVVIYYGDDEYTVTGPARVLLRASARRRRGRAQT